MPIAKYCALTPKGAWALRGQDEASVQEEWLLTEDNIGWKLRINLKELPGGICVEVEELGFKLDLEDWA